MSPSSLSLRFHWVLHQCSIMTLSHGYTAGSTWKGSWPQLNGNLCPLLDWSWRIHSRILVFDTVSHHTQSISPEGWPQTLNKYCIPSKKVSEALWHGHVCRRGEKLKSHLSMSDSWLILPDTPKGPGVHHLHIVGTCLLVWGGRVYIHWNTWRIQLSAFMYWYQDMNWVSVECVQEPAACRMVPKQIWEGSKEDSGSCIWVQLGHCEFRETCDVFWGDEVPSIYQNDFLWKPERVHENGSGELFLVWIENHLPNEGRSSRGLAF